MDTGRALDRQIGSTKKGDRYADCRIRTRLAFDRHFCYATGDCEWSSGKLGLDMRNIPKNIIQFWHDKTEIPKILQNSISVTKRSNDDYKFIFADDHTIYNLLKDDKYYLLDLYKLNRIPASRSDMARLILLYEYGGFYLDVSMEMHKSLNELVEPDDEIILVQRDDDPRYKECPTDAHVINGIIGITPNSDFILWCLKKVRTNLTIGLHNHRVFVATGAMIINEALVVLGDSYKVKKLSFVSLKNEFLASRGAPGISNSWVHSQKEGIIDSSHYVDGLLNIPS